MNGFGLIVCQMCFSGHNLSFFPFFCLTLINRNGANKMNALRKVIRFYVEGFREMTVGRTPVSYTHLTLPTICSV